MKRIPSLRTIRKRETPNFKRQTLRLGHLVGDMKCCISCSRATRFDGSRQLFCSKIFRALGVHDKRSLVRISGICDSYKERKAHKNARRVLGTFLEFCEEVAKREIEQQRSRERELQAVYGRSARQEYVTHRLGRDEEHTASELGETNCGRPKDEQANKIITIEIPQLTNPRLQKIFSNAKRKKRED